MRMCVRSSSFSNRSISAIESISPEETSGVFSSNVTPGLRMSRAMCSIICCASSVMRIFLSKDSVQKTESRIDSKFGMLAHELLASGRTRGFAGGALDDPLGRLQENRTNRHAHARDDAAADFALDFRHHDDVFRPNAGIVRAHRDHAAVVNGGMSTDNLLDVLRINVFAADN